MKWLHKCIIKSSSNSACIGSRRCGGCCCWRGNCCGGGCELGLPVGDEGGGGKMFGECPCLLRYVPSARPRSSSLTDNLLISWTTLSKVELIVQILPSILLILVEKLDCSTSPAIVGAFAEVLTLLDTDGKVEKMIDAG